jgi:putative ABC transport system permease protein
MTSSGFELRPMVKLTEGRWFAPGQREVVVSESIRKRFTQSDIGEAIQFGKGPWKVVGVFNAGGTAHESEIWGDINQMAFDFGREDDYNSALLRATDEVAAAALKRRVSEDQRLRLDGMLETEYYAEQTRSGAPIRFVGLLVAAIMAIGSCFAAMNTMYAAIAYRSREIATLRVLGFSRFSILASFVAESLVLAVFGGLIGIVLMAPFHGMTAGTSNAVTFSEVVFSLRMTPAVVASAIGFAILMGLLGGLAPAWQAARQNIVVALRD